MRFSLFLLCAAACLGQAPKEPPKPPADVDAALRARVQEFFHYHVTGEFRKAEALVADDTKDLFYNRNKPRYLQFIDIARIDYSDNFTKATAIVNVVSAEMIPGWAAGPPTIPIPSTWKIENGKWYWYLAKENFLRTPFGNLPLNTLSQAGAVSPGMLPPALTGVPTADQPAPNGAKIGDLFPAGVAAAGIAPMPGMPMPGMPMAGMPMPGMPTPQAPSATGAAPQHAPDPAALAAIAGAQKLGMSPAGIPGMVPPEALDKIKPDKMAVQLKGDAPERVTFANSGTDSRTLMLLGTLPGIDAKLDRAEVPGGTSAVLTLQAGKDPKEGTLLFVVPQTGEIFTIKVSLQK